MYLSGRGICDPPASEIRGAIVYSDEIGVHCELDQVYLAVDRAGARGLINLVAVGNAGMTCYFHNTWDPEKHNDRDMFVAAVSLVGMDAGTVHAWKASTLRGSISPPHDREMQNTFESWPWTFVFRILAPLLSAYVGAISCTELARLLNIFLEQRNQHQTSGSLDSVRMVTFLIVILETPIMFGCTFHMIVGGGGPYVLPWIGLWIFVFLFSGTSVATTLLTAILMHEETRCAQGLPRRSLATQYRVAIPLIFLLFVGWDIFTVINIVFAVTGLNFFAVSNFVVFVLVLIQAFSAACFVIQARAFKRVLNKVKSGYEGIGTPFAQPADSNVRIYFCMNPE